MLILKGLEGGFLQFTNRSSTCHRPTLLRSPSVLAGSLGHVDCDRLPMMTTMMMAMIRLGSMERVGDGRL